MGSRESCTIWRLSPHDRQVFTIIIPISQIKETEEQNGPGGGYREGQSFKGFSPRLPSPVCLQALLLLFGPRS